VGTYSSTFIGAPILIFLSLRPGGGKAGEGEAADAPAA